MTDVGSIWLANMGINEMKTEQIKPVRAWAIVEPNGRINHTSLRREMEVAIDDHRGIRLWSKFEALGYRCIRVTIAPEVGE